MLEWLREKCRITLQETAWWRTRIRPTDAQIASSTTEVNKSCKHIRSLVSLCHYSLPAAAQEPKSSSKSMVGFNFEKCTFGGTSLFLRRKREYSIRVVRAALGKLAAGAPNILIQGVLAHMQPRTVRSVRDLLQNDRSSSSRHGFHARSRFASDDQHRAQGRRKRNNLSTMAARRAMRNTIGGQPSLIQTECRGKQWANPMDNTGRRSRLSETLPDQRRV